MSYLTQSLLETNADFQRRVNSVNTEQAQHFRTQADPFVAALGSAVLRNMPGADLALLRLAALALADKATVSEDGTLDQSGVTDADLLAATQANWALVAGLYFLEDGSPRPLTDAGT